MLWFRFNGFVSSKCLIKAEFHQIASRKERSNQFSKSRANFASAQFSIFSFRYSHGLVRRSTQFWLFILCRHHLLKHSQNFIRDIASWITKRTELEAKFFHYSQASRQNYLSGGSFVFFFETALLSSREEFRYIKKTWSSSRNNFDDSFYFPSANWTIWPFPP